MVKNSSECQSRPHLSEKIAGLKKVKKMTKKCTFLFFGLNNFITETTPSKILFTDNSFASTLIKTLKNLELFDMDEIYNEFYQKVEELHDLLKFGEVREFIFIESFFIFLESFVFLTFFQDMYTYESRLKSFEDSNWPFSAPDKCCPENLAAAGFFFYPASSRFAKK